MKNGSESTMRLFFTAWPEPEARERLAALRDALECAKARPVASSDLHMTLAFIGDVPTQRLSELQADASVVACHPCELVLDDFQHWQRSLTLAATQPPPTELQTLHEALLEIVERYAKRLPSRHTFRPHVTLLRRVRAMPASLPPPPKLRFAVTGFSLVRSQIDDSGAHYSTVSDYD